MASKYRDPLEEWAMEQDQSYGISDVVIYTTDKVDKAVFNELRDARIQNCIQNHFLDIDKFEEISLRICQNKLEFCRNLFDTMQPLITPEIL